VPPIGVPAKPEAALADAQPEFLSVAYALLAEWDTHSTDRQPGPGQPRRAGRHRLLRAQTDPVPCDHVDGCLTETGLIIQAP
jgi:hypothetical protein